MKIADRVEVNPKIMMGKPVILGTRIPVEIVVRKISEGASERQLLNAYPRLQKEDIKAALRYAADAIAHEEVLTVGLPKRSATK